MAELPITSSRTVSVALSDGTSYNAVDVFTRPPDQSEYVFFTEWWVPIPASPTSEHISSATTTSSSETTPTSTPTPTHASVSPTSTSNAQPIQQGSGSGLSTGVVAVIAVACVVAGFILGVIMSFLFLRRRLRALDAGHHASQRDSQEKPLQAISLTDTHIRDQYLIVPTADSKIGSELSALGQLLQQHVENNYHLQPVSRSANELSNALVHLGLGESGAIPVVELAALALDPKTRYVAIQHVIAKIAFISATFNETTTISLLPEPVSLFLSMIPKTKGRMGNPDALESALTRWRQLSAFLLHPRRGSRTALTPSEDTSTHEAERLAVALNTFLSPFVAGDREERYEQENHLREVIVECVTFDYLLFSQPSEYKFCFDSNGREMSLVVCPGLHRVSDEEGSRFPAPGELVILPVVRSI